MTNHLDGNQEDDHSAGETFQHRKKARKFAVSQLQSAGISTISVSLMLLINFLPRLKGSSPGGILIFIGLAVAFGICAMASLTGGSNLYTATEIGTDPGVALGLINMWRLCGHLARAAIILIFIILPFIFDTSVTARVIVGLICLLVIGLVVASAHFGTGRVDRYVQELEEHVNNKNKAEESSSSSSSPGEPDPRPSAPPSGIVHEEV